MPTPVSSSTRQAISKAAIVAAARTPTTTPAAHAARKSVQSNPAFSQEDPSSPAPHRYLAACYAHMGRLEEARETVKQLRTIASVVIPDASYLRNAEHRELLLSGLRLAAGEET